VRPAHAGIGDVDARIGEHEAQRKLVDLRFGPLWLEGAEGALEDAAGHRSHHGDTHSLLTRLVQGVQGGALVDEVVPQLDDVEGP
jgi:hypothetical protein